MQFIAHLYLDILPESSGLQASVLPLQYRSYWVNLTLHIYYI